MVIILLAIDETNAKSAARQWFTTAKPWRTDEKEKRTATGTMSEPIEYAEFYGFAIGKKPLRWDGKGVHQTR